MKPISWNSNERVLSRTELEGVDHELPVVFGQYDTGQMVAITCWKPSLKELLRLLLTRRIYVTFLSSRVPVFALHVTLADVGINSLENLEAKGDRAD